jgi:hypothetical protein
MRKPAVLVLSLSNLESDPRVNRQLRLLQAECSVTAAGFADPRLPGIEFVPLPSRRKSATERLVSGLRLKLRRFEAYYWAVDSIRAARAALQGRSFDLIVANDADCWPLGLSLRGNGRVLLDAHEYAPLEFEDRFYWRLFYQGYRTWICRECLHRADAVTTVCDGIADEYARVFQVPLPTVILNAPSRRDATPRPTPESPVRLIHHGLASPSRQIEGMIALMDFLDARFTLDLMLVEPDVRYAARLRRLAGSNPRIVFKKPVPTSEIVASIQAYDIGLFLLPPTNFNYRLALPNKFFEFVQARLAVAIGPSPEMARLVRRHQLGVVAEDFEPASLARLLNALDRPAVDRLKEASHRAAGFLCWEDAGQALDGVVKRLLGTPA